MRTLSKSILFLATCAFLAAHGVWAQNITVRIPKELTLEKAKRVALLGNPSVEVLLARIKVAEAVEGQSRVVYLPRLTGTAGAYWHENVSLGNGNDGHRAAYTAGLEVGWLLFDGFAGKFRMEAAKAGIDASTQEWQDGRRLLAQGVAATFLNCLLAVEAGRVEERNAAFNQSLLDEAQKRLDAGAGPRVDVLNFSVRTRESENSLLGIRRQQRAARQALAALLGLPTGKLPEGTQLVMPEIREESLPPKADAAIEIAFSQRPDLARYEAVVEQLALMVKASRGAYSPKLTAVGKYDLARMDNARFNASQDADALVGLALSWDILDWGLRKYSIAEAKANLLAMTAARNNRRVDIAAEVRRVLDTARTAAEQEAKQNEITDMNKQIREIVRKEYLSGISALTRLNEVQTALVTAEGRLAQMRILRVQAIEGFLSTIGQNLPVDE
ncbi:MAG: TolC family protein [Lentisphaeria bacterium]|nr:TolC family protein [Lentisphaeria bacterium]